ncbi:chemotaxis protein CheB [Simiduia agarivorans]|nr:chemotaxis protein CheB [Simiduia agarivorans]
MDKPLRVGLLLDDMTLKVKYQQLIQMQMGQLAGAYDARADSMPDVEADAWLVVLGEALENPALDAWLENQKAPIIFDDALHCQDDNWQRRLEKKLYQLAGMVSLEASRQGGIANAVRAVWVLGASTGGPAAVKAFLQSVPQGLGIAFVYAQHIDQGFDVTLAQVISRGSAYGAVLAGHGGLLLPDSVTIVRPDRETEMLANGTLLVHPRGWAGPYSPAINQVVANVASVYGSRSGAIIFTGMGDDGKAGCRLMKQQGGEVWVQTPESCTVSSMPDEVISTGVISQMGTPEQLARAMHARYRAEQAG